MKYESVESVENWWSNHLGWVEHWNNEIHLHIKSAKLITNNTVWFYFTVHTEETTEINGTCIMPYMSHIVDGMDGPTWINEYRPTWMDELII